VRSGKGLKAVFATLCLLAGSVSVLAASAELSFEQSEPEITALEQRLDDANAALTEAGTYTCKDRRAQKLFDPIWQDFVQQMKEAQSLLGRSPNTQIYVNSCRKSVIWSKFDRTLHRAKSSLKASRAMIKSRDPR
jgi:hypothetical protein